MGRGSCDRLRRWAYNLAMNTILLCAFTALLSIPATAGQSTTTATTTTSTTGAASALGTWNLTFNSQQGEIPAQVTLKKAGDKIVGEISSQMGSSPLEAEVKDKTLSIWFNFQGQSGPVAIEMTGTLDGDKVKGTFAAGGQSAGDFSGTKLKDTTDTTSTKDTKDAKDTKEPAKEPAKEPSASLTGDWNLSVELPNMTATPGMTLKQDGEKLTGEYVSAQYGKYAITGTAKGSDVTFWFAMNVEGTAMNVTYTGKIEKDGSLKGSVNYGDMMSGTFSATKKK